MIILHPKVQKIISHAERRVKKLTGNGSFVLLGYSKQGTEFSFDHVADVVCSVTGVSKNIVFVKSRKKEQAISRHLIALFAKMHCKLSLKKIGNKMGGRHHTTIIHSIKTIKDLIDSNDPGISLYVKEINQRLNYR